MVFFKKYWLDVVKKLILKRAFIDTSSFTIMKNRDETSQPGYMRAWYQNIARCNDEQFGQWALRDWSHD